MPALYSTHFMFAIGVHKSGVVFDDAGNEFHPPTLFANPRVLRDRTNEPQREMFDAISGQGRMIVGAIPANR